MNTRHRAYAYITNAHRLLLYRWFYHLTLAGTPKETWRHGEFAADGRLAIPFDFFWAEITALPQLVSGYAEHIDLLIGSLSTEPL